MHIHCKESESESMLPPPPYVIKIVCTYRRTPDTGSTSGTVDTSGRTVSCRRGQTPPSSRSTSTEPHTARCCSLAAMYDDMLIRTHIHTHTRMHTRSRTQHTTITHTHARTRTRTHARTRTRTHTHTHTHTHTRTHTHTNTHK